MGKIKAKGQFHQIKNEDTGVSSTDSQDYTAVIILYKTEKYKNSKNAKNDKNAKKM